MDLYEADTVVICDGCGEEVSVSTHSAMGGAEVWYVCPLCGHEHHIPASVFYDFNE